MKGFFITCDEKFFCGIRHEHTQCGIEHEYIHLFYKITDAVLWRKWEKLVHAYAHT